MLIPFQPDWRVACGSCKHIGHFPWSAPRQRLVGMSWHCQAPRAGKTYPNGDQRSASLMRAPGMPCGPGAKLREAAE